MRKAKSLAALSLIGGVGSGIMFGAVPAYATTCEGAGCSVATIQIETLYDVEAAVITGEATSYPANANIWVQYQLYGPGGVDLNSGTLNCNTSRPCEIYGGAETIGPGVYENCVWSWVAGVNVQPQDCAEAGIK
jgi:hypothetical protein